MKSAFSFLLICFAFGISRADPTLEACHVNDDSCVERSVKSSYETLIDGVSSMNVNSSDPLKVPVIYGNQTALNFKLTDVTVSGFSNCSLHDIHLDLEGQTLKVQLNCPQTVMRGNYNMNGQLVAMHAEGDGTFRINNGRMRYSIDANLRNDTSDSDTHLQIGDFTVDTEALDPVHFQFDNLFNGNTMLSENLHRYANDNWREVADELQTPLSNAYFQGIIDNMNEYLKQVSYDSLVMQ